MMKTVKASDVKKGMRLKWVDENFGYSGEGIVTRTHHPGGCIFINFGGCERSVAFEAGDEFELLRFEIKEPEGVGSVIRSDGGYLWVKDFSFYWILLDGKFDTQCDWQKEFDAVEVLFDSEAGLND